MLKNGLVLLLSIFILSSCVTGPDGYFKRSANNKLFDRKGFHGNKRSPLYNKKYIEKAKRNVANSSFEDEDEDDSSYMENEYNPSNSENVSLENREMYRRMLQEDIERRDNRRQSKRSHSRDLEYPSISKANSGFYEDRNESNELKKELDEIKSMLNDAKRDMASHKCPTAEEIERQRSFNQTKSQKQQSGNISRKTNGDPDTTIIEPVKSI